MASGGGLWEVEGNLNLLSLLANLMARVQASGSPSLTSAAAFQTHERSEPTLGESFMSGTTVCFGVGMISIFGGERGGGEVLGDVGEKDLP